MRSIMDDPYALTDAADNGTSWWDAHKFWTGIAIGFALALLVACHPAYAQYADVPNTLKIDVPNHNVTVGIVFVSTGVGTGLQIRERTMGTAGAWTGVELISPKFPEITQADIDAKGGHLGFITALIPQVNAALAKRYPRIDAMPAGNVSAQLNYTVNSYFGLTLNADGTVSFGAK